MLHTKGINWADLDPLWKNGTLLAKRTDGWSIEREIEWIKEERFFEYCDSLMNPIKE